MPCAHPEKNHESDEASQGDSAGLALTLAEGCSSVPNFKPVRIKQYEIFRGQRMFDRAYTVGAP